MDEDHFAVHGADALVVGSETVPGIDEGSFEVAALVSVASTIADAVHETPGPGRRMKAHGREGLTPDVQGDLAVVVCPNGEGLPSDRKPDALELALDEVGETSLVLAARDRRADSRAGAVVNDLFREPLHPVVGASHVESVEDGAFIFRWRLRRDRPGEDEGKDEDEDEDEEREPETVHGDDLSGEFPKARATFHSCTRTARHDQEWAKKNLAYLRLPGSFER